MLFIIKEHEKNIYFLILNLESFLIFFYKFVIRVHFVGRTSVTKLFKRITKIRKSPLRYIANNACKCNVQLLHESINIILFSILFSDIHFTRVTISLWEFSKSMTDGWHMKAQTFVTTINNFAKTSQQNTSNDVETQMYIEITS